MNDLIYKNVIKRPEEEEEEFNFNSFLENPDDPPKKKNTSPNDEVRKIQKHFYDNNYYEPDYLKGKTEDQVIDGLFWDHTSDAYNNMMSGRGAKPGDIAKPVSKSKETSQEEPSRTLSNDEKMQQFWKDIGYDNLPELDGYTNERRKKRGQYQQDMYNLSKAFRGVIQGVAGNNGSLLTKFEPDSVTPRVQQELMRIRDMDDQNERNVLLRNWTQKLKGIDLKAGYLQNLENQDRADDRTDIQIKAQDARYKQSNEEWDRRYGKQTDPDYLKMISKIEQDKQIAVAKARTAEEQQQESNKYDQMLEYHRQLKEEGLGTYNTSDKKDSDKQALADSRKQAMIWVDENMSMSFADQMNLPPFMQKILSGEKLPSDRELDYIAEMIKSQQKTAWDDDETQNTAWD